MGANGEARSQSLRHAFLSGDDLGQLLIGGVTKIEEDGVFSLSTTNLSEISLLVDYSPPDL